MAHRDSCDKDCLDHLSLTTYAITFILGLPFNLLALGAFFRQARHKSLTPNVVYMTNLCLANLVFITWLPIKIMETLNSRWTLPAVLCPLYNFCHFSTLYASALFLTAISVGRYLSIAFPIQYKIYKKAKNSCMVCLVLWALVLIHVALVSITEGNGSRYFVFSSSNNTSTCFENFTQAQLDFLVPLRLEMSIVLFLAPLLVTTFCYLSCITLVLHTQMCARRKKRVILVAVTTLLVFVACFAPYNISHVVGFIKKQSVWWRREALLTSTCNAFLEPIIFFFLSSSMEQSICHCWLTVREKSIGLDKTMALSCHRATE
ncbi:free fatty acid receptor 2 [Polypterus senegalus]|uniref:free fatty acid receptor 2 n=1 Tax=Polypterus senegalus TaxID=55291 RepID=UPI0019623A5C|nr:free fatty acid receptor 2 [Polypterus senegalus]